MRAVILGATGLAGQAICAEALARGFDVRRAARRGADIDLDISDDVALQRVLHIEDPDLVVNAAALVNIAACESESGWRVNARPLSLLAEWSRSSGRALIHMSTDHFFAEGGATPHGEGGQITLVNDYARQKFAAEAFALLAPRALVLRTSIVGLRGWQEPTFAEWAIEAVRTDREMTLFADAYTSSIHVGGFARGALDLLDRGAVGLYNLGAREVYSKEAFIREIAAQMGSSLTRARSGSVHEVLRGRASSLGLDVSRAEAILNYQLPTLAEVVAAILQEHERRTHAV